MRVWLLKNIKRVLRKLKRESHIVRKIFAFILSLAITIYLHQVKKKTDDSRHIFQECWQFLLKDKFFIFLFPLVENPFQLNYREMILLQLVKKMQHAGIPYFPKIMPVELELLHKLIQPAVSALVVSVHNGLALTTRVISDLGRSVTTISSDPYITSTFIRSGIKCPINVIKNDRYCLAFLRKAISNADVICCDVDFYDSNGRYVYVSPALFEYSARFNIPLYFAKYEVMDDGCVSLSLKESIPSVKADNNIESFIKFVNSSPDSIRELSINNFIRY